MRMGLIAQLAAGLTGPRMQARGRSWLVAACALALGAILCAGPAVAAAGAPVLHWGRAERVPGLGTLNNGGDAQVLSVSCAAAGECAAGGYLTVRPGDYRLPFVASEHDGRWGAADVTWRFTVFGEVVSVSCVAPGDCLAGGFATRGDGTRWAFVTAERGGRWLGTAQVGLSPNAEVTSVSCWQLGNCVAGGWFSSSRTAGGGLPGSSQAFVATETAGRWAVAQVPPGLAAMGKGQPPKATVSSVSCTAGGYCLAGGSYDTLGGPDSQNRPDAIEGFVIAAQKGAWGQARGLPGLVKLNQGGDAAAVSVSCASAGNCAAGGFWADRGQGGGKGPWGRHGFTDSQVDGHWQQARRVAGPPAAPGAQDQVLSVSCTSTGSCGAAGTYESAGSSYRRWYVVTGNRGRWQRAVSPPGGAPAASSIYCSGPGDCVAAGAGGSLYPSGGRGGAFVVAEWHGRWGKAERLPGLAALGGYDAIESVSCGSSTNCIAGGSYRGLRGYTWAFVST